MTIYHSHLKSSTAKVRQVSVLDCPCDGMINFKANRPVVRQGAVQHIANT
jgi:hypothetical protein